MLLNLRFLTSRRLHLLHHNLATPVAQCYTYGTMYTDEKKLVRRDSSLASANCNMEEYVDSERSVGVTSKEQQTILKRRPVQTASLRLLKVAIIGAPNAGKSTLLNRLLNWKVSPVSEKVHTTRSKTVGVLTEEDKQVVFLDTPGIITPAKAKRHSLEISLLLDPHVALQEADLVVVVVDVSPVWNRTHLDQELLKLLHIHQNTSSVLVLNKVDLIKPKDILLAIVRSLTDGVVCKRKDWSTIKTKKNKVRLEELFSNDKIEDSCMTETSHKLNIDPTDISNDLACKTTSTSSEHEVMDTLAESNIAIGNDPVIKIKDSLEIRSDRFSKSRLETADLHVPEVWAAYYRHLCEAGKQMQDVQGWQQFDAVFMISAADGDGVDDLKNYLLDCTYPSQWIYHRSVVTDQNPVKLAKLIVRECLLNHLPDEIPYNIQVKLTLWELENDNYLRAAFDIHCKDSRHASVLLGKQGQTLRVIAGEAKQQLMNVFHKEMSLKLSVRSPTGSREARYKSSELTRSNVT